MSSTLSRKLRDSGVRTLSCCVSMTNIDVGMADFQYHPDSNAHVAKLRRAMDDMNGMYLCLWSNVWNKFTALQCMNCVRILFHPNPWKCPRLCWQVWMKRPWNWTPLCWRYLKTKINSLIHNAAGLRTFPPPLFSRQAIPQGYKLVPSKSFFSLVLTSLFKFQGQYSVDGDDSYWWRDRRGEKMHDQHDALERLRPCSLLCSQTRGYVLPSLGPW